MLSIFPMVGISLGNNLQQFVPDSMNNRLGDKWSRIVCRLVATVPPLICAAVMGEINKIFDISGLFAFFLQLFFPAALQLLSKRFCERMWGHESTKTPYSMFIGHSAFVWITIVFGALAFLFSVFALIAPDLVAKYT